MDHTEVIEAVDSRFMEGWDRARSQELTLSITPLNGLSNIIESLVCEEYGWDQIDRSVLLPYLTEPDRFQEIDSRISHGDSLEMTEALSLCHLRNRALGEYGKTVYDTIRHRHGI